MSRKSKRWGREDVVGGAMLCTVLELQPRAPALIRSLKERHQVAAESGGEVSRTRWSVTAQKRVIWGRRKQKIVQWQMCVLCDMVEG
jgi:hypothetical protein